ncbi:MAG: ABC-F family ATP-binding cassette domain-containing protein [Anaerolineae bacterium]|nr:ABC-F family ATP-binding cassette domain-containing protein [Anaerolineae bacterium]
MSAIVINIDHVGFYHAAELVLEDVSWEIQAGQTIGLVGPNGAGKSTLLKLINGDHTPDSGIIARHNVRIGYLPQEPAFTPGTTVWNTVLGANRQLHDIEATMHRLETRMGDPAVYQDEEALNRVLDHHAHAQAEFEKSGGYRYESRCRQALQTAGFADSEEDIAVDVLSGGQKKMLGLAQLLATQCDVLLLDEPDNHLDLQGKMRLEQFIHQFPGTVIIVSHDRYLLDETVDHIAELEDYHLTLYTGNYTAYATEKQLRLLKQQQAYAAQQKEISRIEAAIARFEYWASIVINERHIRQARSRHKMLGRMDRIDKPITEREKMGLALNGWRGSNKVLEIVGLDMVFDDHIVLMGLDVLIWRGERVGLIGGNGSGKSVLFKCILDKLAPTAGVIKIGPSISIGYYAQEHEILHPDLTLIEEIWETQSMSEHAVVNFLRRFLFPYRRTRDTVSTLSGGERSRMQLAKLMLTGANFLLLDEPTNNLDLPSCEVLEQVLEEFEGTVLVISHDRYFLNRIVDRIVELEDGALTTYNGDYTYYAEQKAKKDNL